MKKIFFFILIITSSTAFCQIDSSLIKKRMKDSMITDLQNKFATSRENIINVLDIVNAASSKMSSIAHNKVFTNSSKTIQLKQIAAQRDAAINKLLTPLQVSLLRKHFVDNRTRMENAAPKKLNPLKN